MPSKKRSKNHRIRDKILNDNLNSPPITRSNSQRAKNIPNILNSQNNMAEAKLENILQHLPCFDGKKEANIDFFLKQWDTLATDSKLKPEIKLILLKAKFSGTARETLINSKSLNEESDYTSFIEKIKKEFKPKLNFETVQNSFLSLKQQPNETIEQFLQKFDMAATRYVELSGNADQPGTMEFLNKIKLSKFIESIRSDIALEIRKQDPDTYEKATQIALKTEAAFNAIPHESINVISHNKTNYMVETLENFSKNYKEELEKLREEFINFYKNDTESKQQQAQSIKCDICDKTNHLTKDCFQNPKNIRKHRQTQQNQFVNKYKNSMANYNTPYNCQPMQNVMPVGNPFMAMPGNYMPSPNNYTNWGSSHNNTNPTGFVQFYPQMNRDRTQYRQNSRSNNQQNYNYKNSPTSRGNHNSNNNNKRYPPFKNSGNE